jgi:hypothetical protein
LRKLIYLLAILVILIASPIEAKQWVYPATSLTGGGTGALDAIDGQNLQDGDMAKVTNSTGTYDYYLDSTSGLSENSPRVIAPDVNAGTKRWILVKDPSKYYVNSGAADQGLDGNDYSLWDIAGNIGTTKKATVIFPHTASGTTTAFSFATRLDLSAYSNITFQIENGAVLVPASGVTIALPRPGNLSHNPEQTLFNVSAAGSGVTFYQPGNIRPEMYGADNTGATDSYAAMNAAVYCVKAMDYSTYNQGATLLLKSGGIYKLGTSLFLGSETATGAVRNVSVDGEGQATLLIAHTGIGVDWTGAHFKKMEHVRIQLDTTTIPSIGMLLSRYAHAGNGGLTTLRDVGIYGTATLAGLYNYASEEFNADNCEFRVTAPYVAVVTRSNELAVTIPHEDGSLADESATNFYFNQCTFYSLGASGSATNSLLIGSAGNVHFINSQFHDAAEDIALVKLRKEATSVNQPSAISFYGCLFHDKYLYGIQIDGATSQITVDGSNQWGTATGAGAADIIATASSNVKYSYFEANSIDFSAANADLLSSNEIHLSGTTQVFKAGRYCYADVFHDSGATVNVTTPSLFFGSIRNADTGQVQTYHPSFVNLTLAQTSGTTEAPLMEISGVSGFRGSRFSVKAGGYFNNDNGGQQSVVMYFGTASGITVIPAYPHTDNNDWSVEMDCFASKGSNTNQYCILSGITNTSTGTTPTMLYHRSRWNPGTNITSGNTVAFHGICTDSGDTVYQQYLDVNFK